MRTARALIPKGPVAWPESAASAWGRTSANTAGWFYSTAAARKAGMSEAMLGELIAVIGMANETNAIVNGFRVEVDPQFKPKV
jgi:hypothetical protein